MSVILFRGLCGLIVLMGGLLYTAIVYSCYISWSQSSEFHELSYDTILFIIHCIIGSGLPPLILAFYFFIPCKKIIDFGIGLSIVFLAIMIHFYVFGVTVHEPYIGVLFQCLELFAALLFINFWQHRYRVPSKRSLDKA